MAKTNYNKMSNKAKEDVKKDIEPVVEEVTVDAEPIVEEPVLEVKVVYGTVVDCEKLNVRSKPSIKGDIICVITKDTKVVVAESGSTKDFYEVHSIDDANVTVGFHGWCMKKYISVK